MKAATNSEVRMNNRRRLLRLLFTSGEMSKQDISLKLNMSLSTVNYLVKELMENELLTTGTQLGSTGGRKPVCIKPVNHARYSIGAEAASDVVRIVGLDLGAHIIARESYPLAQENTADYWRKLGELISEFAKKNKIPKNKLLDIGVTVGITMQDDRVAARKEKVQEYVFDMDLARESIGMPVHFRHGTKMAAVAQCRRNESAKNFIYIYLGAKISGAIIYDGKVVDFSGINGELGCMLTLNPSDSVRVDSIFSRKILCKKAGCKNLPEFFTKVKEKDPVCTPIWHTYLEQLTLFAHDIFCLFGWPIVLGGSVSPYIGDDLAFLEEKVHEYYAFEEIPDKILSVSSLGEYGSAVGAALVSINRFFDSDI